MKKILSLALLLSSFTLFAQQTPKKDVQLDRKRTELADKIAEEEAKKRTDHIDREVRLTEKQRKEVYALYLKEAKATIAAEQQASQGANTVQKSANKGSNDEVHKLLTVEQRKVLTDKQSKKENAKSNTGQKGKKKAKSTDGTKK